MHFRTILSVPILFMLLLVSRPEIAGAQDDAPSDNSRVLINTNTFSAPPPTSEYDNIPPGMLMTQEDAPTAAPDSIQSDTDVMTMREILNAYDAGRYDVVFKHLLPIANTDYPQAQELIGIMYSKGQGVEQNDQAAIGWLTKAAETGRPLAEHYLATLTYLGRGTAPDAVTALMWLYIAIVHYPDGPDKVRAIQDRTNLAARLSRRDRLRAYELAHDWLKKRDEAALFDAETMPQ